MAITIKLDLTNGSEANRTGPQGGFAVRAGMAYGLPTDTLSMNPEAVLFNVMTATGMPAYGDVHPAINYLFVKRIQVLSLPSTQQQCRFNIYYESLQGNGALSSYIIETAASPSTIETNQIPGSGIPIRVAYAPSTANTAAANAPEKSIPADFAPVSLYRPIAHIRTTQLLFGSLTPTQADAFSDNLCCVNNAVWLGRPIGTWLCTDAGASISVYDGYYTKRIEATRRKGQIWREYAVLRSQVTGRLAGGDDMQATLDALRAEAYSYGVGYEAAVTGDDPMKTGACRVDAYEAISFATLFGFSS